MSDLTEFQYKLSQIHLDLYHLWLDIDTTDEEAEVVDKILEVFHGAWEMNNESQTKEQAS